MKKLLLISLLIFLSTGAHAQARIMAKLGSCWSNNKDNDGNTNDKRLGLTFGIDAELPFSEMFSFRPGLMYISKGSKETGRGDFATATGASYQADVEENVSQNYLELPLRIGFRLPLGSDFSLLASAGFYMAYGISGTIRVSADNSGYTQSVETNTFDEDQNINRFDAGYMLGAGIAYKRFQLELGAENGFTSILKETMNNQKVINKSIVLTLGYQLTK
jgi:opacity protein-like surface antigen